MLRTSLRPGLLRAIAYNESHRRTEVALFEIGHVYPPAEGELPGEYEALTVVLAGREAPAAMAVWRELAAALGTGARIDQSKRSGRAARHSLGDAAGGQGPARRRRRGGARTCSRDFEVTERVAILELDLDQILDREPKPTQWKPTSRYPSSDLDLSFVVPDDIPAEKVEKAVRQGAGKLLVDLDLFDVYRGERAAEGTRSLAYRVRLQAADRNLTDADVADVRRGVEAAATKLGAQLRS